MPLLSLPLPFLRTRKRSLRSSLPSMATLAGLPGRASMANMPAMPQITLPQIDRQQIELAIERGRSRMESLADTVTAEQVASLI